MPETSVVAPTTAAAEAQLRHAIRRLTSLRPAFMSVTCGAGGSTREGTHAIVKSRQADTGVSAAVHFTCANASRDGIAAVTESCWATGSRHIVVLRGDPPDGVAAYPPQANGYARADALVRACKVAVSRIRP